MRELARIMPERSWIQTADANVSGDPTSTGADQRRRPPPAPPSPTANLVGCTPKQSDTAAMMVRLGKLYRVNDVQLNESTPRVARRRTRPTRPRSTRCGSYYKYDLTVTFSATPPGP